MSLILPKTSLVFSKPSMILCEHFTEMSAFCFDVDSFSYFAVGATGEISISFDGVTSVLRLSTKYDIPTFRTKSIFELRKLFPSTLSGFYALFPRGNLDPSHTLIMQAINVARETNVLELLPCAFYFL